MFFYGTAVIKSLRNFAPLSARRRTLKNYPAPAFIFNYSYEMNKSH